ncbi:MAG: AmmeMemoRadiSam system radical SAM enzyme [Anaerolineae bacterium]|nr:AmmeMemoRadiSam system radical SAM enzyme [Anaerolineae bacterium]
MRKAKLYERLSDKRVQCHLCAHHCVIYEGERGLCGVRENQEGNLYTLVYGKLIAEHIDPVEKKPLFHFYPGSRVYSIATPGCNFRCHRRQNWEISQLSRQERAWERLGHFTEPEEVVARALRHHCRSIAFTYTEPTIFFEYSYDTARLAEKAGLATIYVTNGFMTRSMLSLLYPYLDAANVDLKAFSDATYHTYMGARLQPVLDSMRKMKELGIWLEITTLVIPGLNDDPTELQDAADFIARVLGNDTPWHITAFSPAYQKQQWPPTPLHKLQKAVEIGREAGLQYVYLGNVTGNRQTLCPACGALLVDREGYQVQAQYVTAEGRCPECGTEVTGVWMQER